MPEKRLSEMNQKELDEWWKEYRKTRKKQPIGEIFVGAIFWIIGILMLLIILGGIRAAGGGY